LHPIFVVPDGWKVESSTIIQQTMIPLLTKAGIHFDTEDYRDRVLFIAQLEAGIADLQLNKTSKQLPYIHNKNRCILYTLYEDEQFVKLKATLFQVKEDYNLRLFNEKYYSLNIISMDEITISEESKLINSIQHHLLKGLIFKKLLKMEQLTANDRSRKSVADDILDDILYYFFVCLCIHFANLRN
jgi:hypothetical protein